MTLEGTLDGLTFNTVTMKQAYQELEKPDKKKLINYFLNRDKISNEPLKDHELSQLTALVGILQILYNSGTGSTPVSDSSYDVLQEMLVNMGIPRLSGSLEINDTKKESHRFTSLRGTLSKVYYLFKDDVRTNKSRKYLDEWIKSQETLYEKRTGKKIDLNERKVLLTPKFDGGSCVLEASENKKLWLTRGDTKTNRASDITHIMRVFNGVYDSISKDAYEDNEMEEFIKGEFGIQFEIMMTEDNMEKINKLVSPKYKNSRQIVTSTINSKEPDFKVDYLYPIPLRMTSPGSKIAKIHPGLYEFPTEICLLSDRDKIKQFSRDNKWVMKNGMRFRTDGVVITIIDPKIQEVLGRDNNINNFEVAYKFTEETAYTKVRDIEFQVSEMGFICPVLVVNDVILKGNTINRISLSNKERFDELFFSYGDDVKVLYDIIPYATRDEKCSRVKKGRKINFPTHCPSCRAELDLDVTQVQCRNDKCPARIIGKILNYCNGVKIENIGYSTLETLWYNDLLKNGIRSLYKLKKKSYEIEDLEGFGKLKTRKIISEIESKRRLPDHDFFGSIGIESLSIKTFKAIFTDIPYKDFMNMISLKNFELLMSKLLLVDGIGGKKAEILVNYFKDSNNRKEVIKLIEDLSIYETFGSTKTVRGHVVFSGFRDNALEARLEAAGYRMSTSVTKATNYLIVKNINEETSKVAKANELGIKIITLNEIGVLGRI